MLGHAAGIDGYRILSWAPDRSLVVRRKVILDFSPTGRPIGKKLVRINPSPVGASKRFW
jgi:hypothetical protein